MTARPHLPLALLLCLLAGGCATAPTVVAPEIPPAQAQLDSGYEAQIEALNHTIALMGAQLSTIGGCTFAITLGLEHTPESAGKPVIEQANEIIVANAGAPTPEDKAKALELANAQLRKDKAKVDELLGRAKDAASALDTELAKARGEITARDKALADLKVAVAQERKDKAAEYQQALDAKDKALADYKAEQASKQRLWWINGVRGVGLLLLVVGIVVLAMSKGMMLVQGAGLVLGGALVIGIGMAYDIVTSQKWFPYAAAVLGVLILGAMVWTCIHFYRQGQLRNKLTAVLNDVKTEAETLGEDGKALWSKIEPHVEYRLGQAGSAARKELDKLQVKLGLDS